MLRAHHVRPLVIVLTALLILLGGLRLAAQKQTTEKTNSNGPGTTETTYYNPDGTIDKVEVFDPKGKRVRVINHYYDPDTHKVIQLTVEHYRPEDGSLSEYDMLSFDGNGEIYKIFRKNYDSQGTQTRGTIFDFVNDKKYEWDPTTGRYQEATPRVPETPTTPPGKKPGEVSYQPTELGMIVPANLKPGETFSGTVMPASEAKAYASVPGFNVQTIQASVPGGKFTSTEDQGLLVGTVDDPQPLQDGHFTSTVPTGRTGFSLATRQETQPSTPSTVEVKLTTPTWASEPVISPPVRNASEMNFWLGYLNYLWFKVTDYEEEYWDALNDGAPGWVLDEIEDDQDNAGSTADYLAYHLPLDAVRTLAQSKASWEHWVDDTYHGGMSLVHKDNADFYLNFAVPQDYYAREVFHALVAPPILQVGRLSVLRGDFSGDRRTTEVRVDGAPVRFIASTKSSYYFMPPGGVTPGPHTLSVRNGVCSYEFPVFFMKLMMSLDIASLHTKIYPTSTGWHLVLTGLNGMPSSYWTGGGFSPDLASLSDLGTLPTGYQMPDQSRQGNIIVNVSNLSPTIILIPDFPESQRTWVLDAQNFAPMGEFRVDANAKALRQGVFNIHGLAVATLKPVEGKPVRAGGSAGRVPDTNPPQSVEQAGQAYLEAQRFTKAQRLAMIDDWKKAYSRVRPQLSSVYETAGKEYGAAFTAWRNFVKEYQASPSDENRNKLVQLKQERLLKKVRFEGARETLLNSMSPTLHDAWLAAHANYQSAAERQAHARTGLETVWKAASVAK